VNDKNACKANVFKIKDLYFRRFYDMRNPHYRTFMIEIVQNLEPYHQHEGIVMMKELDEVGEITFVH